MNLSELPLEDLSASAVWSALDADVRKQAARSLYADKESRREADAAIASTLRFREVAVRKLPVDQRVDYVVGRVRADENLASSLLLALHLDQRRPLLEAFLDALGVPQQDGVIDANHELEARDEATLAEAVAQLDKRFARPEVDLYLACLLAMDPEPWASLIPLLRQRA